MHARPWQVVKDPISALSLTLERVGWRFAESSPDVLLDERGRERDIYHFTPARLGGLAREAAKRAIGLMGVQQRPADFWPWGSPPSWRTSLELLHAPAEELWGPHQKACLRRLQIGGVWSQARLLCSWGALQFYIGSA